MCDVDYALHYETVQRKGLTSGEESGRPVSYTEVFETYENLVPITSASEYYMESPLASSVSETAAFKRKG